jgi:hypothetical protein
MATTLREKIAALPAERRAKVEARTTELIAEEMSLQDLRKAMKQTQVRMAKRLKVGQDTVSRVETRADMLISTLRSYVKAMGGELDLVASFPGRAPVRLADLGVIAPRPPKRSATPATSRSKARPAGTRSRRSVA